MIDIDLLYLATIWFARKLRKPDWISYAMASITPLIEVQTDFYQFFDRIKDELSYDGRVEQLERLLNNRFDNTLRRIYIDDADQLAPLYLFNLAEDNEPTYINNFSETASPDYVFNQGETNEEADFVVYVPSGLTYNQDLMKSLLNRYKYASKRYSIQTF